MDQQNPGRVAVVTGAGTGIGAATAHRLAGDGYTVVLVGRTEATLAQTARAGPAMHPWVADVSDLAEVTAAMDGAAERFGRLDVLVDLVRYREGKWAEHWAVADAVSLLRQTGALD